MRISEIYNKIKSLIRLGFMKKVNNDKFHQTADVSLLGVEQRAVIFSPFGLYSFPEKKSIATLLQCGGKEESLIALLFDPSQRPKNMKEGDVGLATGKMSLMLHKNGTIEIKGASDEILNLLSDFMEEEMSVVEALMSATVATALGAQPLDPDTIISLTTAWGNMAVIKGKFDSMKV